jgi:hypothetical protein
MNAYYKHARGLVEEQNDPEGCGKSLTPVKIEEMVKLCKTHWCAIDFDAKFIAENSIL